MDANPRIAQMSAHTQYSAMVLALNLYFPIIQPLKSIPITDEIVFAADPNPLDEALIRK